jgi:hypothetical protein
VLDRAEAPAFVRSARLLSTARAYNGTLSVDPDQPAACSAELAQLLERHPRALWSAQPSPTVRFWLEVHDEFRRECVALTLAGEDWREGRTAARELAVTAGPRLRGMVGRLRGHHEIEDYHYFPTFRAAAPRLAAGFDLLASDHVQLHADIEAAVAALADLLAAADSSPSGEPPVRHSADRYLRLCEQLARRLVRHLSDEEDLIVPLLLESGA